MNIHLVLTFAVGEFRVVLIKDKQISQAWLKIVMRRKGRILSEVDDLTDVRNIIKFWPLLTILSLFGEF